MATISENLTTLQNTLTAIKTALTNKGITPSDALVDVPSEIDSIQTGGGSETIQINVIHMITGDATHFYKETFPVGVYDSTGYHTVQPKSNHYQYEYYDVEKGACIVPLTNNGNTIYRGDISNPGGGTSVQFKHLDPDGDNKLQLVQAMTDQQEITFYMIERT